MPLPIEELIADLTNSDTPLSTSRLTELSNLSSKELEYFKNSWPAIELKRQHQIMHRLLELAEDNIELNFDSIFKYCLKDQDNEVRSKAIEGLWENEEAPLINPLINLLEQDSSEKVQAAAATALGKFALLAEHKKLHSHYALKIEEALLAAINNQNKPIEVRRRALEAAASLNLPRVKSAIMEAYQSRSSKLKISAIHAMGKSCDPSWLPMLLKELANTDAEVRYEAAGACGELEEEAAMPHLIKLINDPDVDVQLAAIQVLGKVGSAEAKECLKQCLNDPSAVISLMAEQALEELKATEEPFSFPI